MSTGFLASLLICISLFACGSRPSLSAIAAGHDSATPGAEQGFAAPASRSEAETAGAAVKPIPARAVPSGVSVPAIVSKVFPTAVSVQSVSQPFAHRVIRDSAGTVIGYEVFSDSAGVTAQGYGGTVPVQVLFDSRGRPVRIFILDNCETPVYMDLVYRAGLLDSLLRFDPAKPDSVDAVTIATSSSRAIAAGVTRLATRVATELALKSDTELH